MRKYKKRARRGIEMRNGIVNNKEDGREEGPRGQKREPQRAFKKILGGRRMKQGIW
jgi:hypothetical protein